MSKALEDYGEQKSTSISNDVFERKLARNGKKAQSASDLEVRNLLDWEYYPSSAPQRLHHEDHHDTGRHQSGAARASSRLALVQEARRTQQHVEAE